MRRVGGVGRVDPVQHRILVGQDEAARHRGDVRRRPAAEAQELEFEAAARSETDDGRKVVDDHGGFSDRPELVAEPGDERVRGEGRIGSVLERLESHDQKRSVRLHLAVEQAVADDRHDARDAVGGAHGFLDALCNRIGAVDRCTFGQDDLAEDGALVFGGRKPVGVDWNSQPVPAMMTARATIPTAAMRTSRLTTAA